MVSVVSVVFLGLFSGNAGNAGNAGISGKSPIIPIIPIIPIVPFINLAQSAPHLSLFTLSERALLLGTNQVRNISALLLALHKGRYLVGKPHLARNGGQAVVP